MIGGFIGQGIGVAGIGGGIVPPAVPLQTIDFKGFIQNGCGCGSFSGCMSANIMQGDDYLFSLRVYNTDNTEINYDLITGVSWAILNAQGAVITKTLDDGIEIDAAINATFEETDTDLLNGVYSMRVIVSTATSQATVLRNSNLETPSLFVKAK